MTPKAAKRKATSSKPVVTQSSADVQQYDIDVPTPAPAGKRKSAPDDESSPKRQKLPVRVKSSGSGRHRSLSVEMPFPEASQRDRSDEVQDSQDEESDAQDETEVFKTPMTRKHVKFDSDDYDEFVTPLERTAPGAGSQPKKLEDVIEDSEEDEEDSDDEAPETVSTYQAAAQSAKAAQAAAKAAEQLAAARKRKRRERDTQLKQQAESRKLARAQRPSRDGEKSESEETAQPQVEGYRRKRMDIPDVLPPEFLESDDEEDEDDTHDASEVTWNKKVKFETIERRVACEDRAPRDEQVGNTVYRVVKDKTDKKLAPKMRKETRNLKEQFLSRNRVPQKRKGFLVKA